jgi:hypothetical protein
MSQSPYIVNIVELQNVVTNVQGTNTAANLQSLQTAVGNLQEMVMYDTKTIAADVLSNFTASNSITVAGNMNFSNVNLYSNGTQAYLNVGTSVYGTSGTATSAGSFSTLTANMSTLSVSSLFATYAYIQNLYQPSDHLLKTKLETFSTTATEVLQLQPKRFEWRASGKSDLGFIAQEVQSVWPELVSRDPNGTLNLEYSKFIPLLLESIRELKARVEVLESAMNRPA